MILVRLLFQTVVLAFTQIWANKARALLTTLGIIIAVAAVISSVAAMTGMRRYVLSEFETFGAKKVFIDGDVPRRLRGVVSWSSVQISPAELRSIATNATTLANVTPMIFVPGEVRVGTEVRTAVPVTGIWPSWHAIEGRSVVTGRQFSSIDEEQRLQVCLVNDKAIRELQLEKDPVNDTLLISGRRFLIVGVVETKELAGFFPGAGDTQSEIFIPYATAQAMQPETRISYVLGELRDAGNAQEAIAEVGFILSRARNIRPGDEPTFEVQALQNIIDSFNSLASGLTYLIVGIVFISLLVGGIGIMNIMLVSVSERTREIGLRKAVGARSEVILLQFLVEAVVLCLAGGAVGLAIGQGLAVAMASAPGSPLTEASVPGWAVLLAVGFSAATGVIFGMFPAVKAARLDPIEALRHE